MISLLLSLPQLHLNSRMGLGGSQAEYFTHSSNYDDSERFASLTQREKSVVMCIAQGLSSKQIAGALGLSIKTVEFHKGNIYGKLGCRAAVSVVRHAIRVGFIDP
jgi:DNA-binding CsgD family transcriptional regulator